MTKLAIRNLSRNPLRIGTTSVPGDGSTVVVDDTDGNVQRDLRTHSGRWTQVASADGVFGATFAAPTVETAEARTVSVQLTDAAGEDLAVRGVVELFVSSDANGDTPVDGTLTIALTAGTDGAILPGATAGARAVFVSEADGDIDVILTDSAGAAASVYLHAILPTGKIVTSAIVTFA